MTPMEKVMQKPLIAVLLASAFFTLDAQAADLIQVYQQALANDATFASARASSIAGQELVPQGRAGLLPTIGITGGVTRAKNDSSSGVGRLSDPSDPTSPVIATSGTNYSTNKQYTVALQQPLFRWDRWETYQ